jgi:hypothetical protein
MNFSPQHALILCLLVIFSACRQEERQTPSPIYNDVAFQQEFSIKYDIIDSTATLKKVRSDRNGMIQVLASTGLLKPFAGEFLYPGTLVKETTYRPLADKEIRGLSLYKEHFVYADPKAILSNAWAGQLYARHTLQNPVQLAGGDDFSFLISDGKHLQFIKDSALAWEGNAKNALIDIVYDQKRKLFWLLHEKGVDQFLIDKKVISEVYQGSALTSFSLAKNDEDLVVGSMNGYVILNAGSGNANSEPQKKLPCPQVTSVTEINGRLWFGSTKGAFTQTSNGNFNYYASKRWLPSDRVIDIAEGPSNSILILTDKGLAKICSKQMTLYDKAMYYEQQVRARHIRHGFNATMGLMKDGSLATGSLEDSDNDGLWTTMYLGAEVFRYAVTKSEDALHNIEESMEAMERLYSINGVKGFPSRSFERRGYKYHDEAWRRASHPEWDWKSTTSSDEAIGHIFAFATMAEVLDGDLKVRAIRLIDSLMQHTLDNDMYLVDWDGKPTRWGRWNPEYVNARPVGVGDRKINSSNIIAMLQTAYHFTKKEAYKEKAFELMTKHGYYDNLMLPMKRVGKAPEDADDWSKMLSESWNHSDDEMYFIGYWGLYRYAFNDTLKTKFKEAIIDHWEIERPEKEAAWNIFTALTGAKDFDLEESVWYLQEYPLDLIHWRVKNSERNDIDLIEPNFREQRTKEVLPPDELPVNRHNANRFELDGGDNGQSEYSAGDIWLLPYWMGRYLGVISEPIAP